MITKTFKAKDASGKEYEILLDQPKIDASTLEGRASVLGQGQLLLADGTKVNRIEQGRYKILFFDPIEVTSDDPAAP